MKSLETEPIKTGEQFRDNYKKHDLARDIVLAYMKQRHIKVIDYGDDRREERVWEAGKDKPDAIIWHPELQLAFVDWKGHKDDKWMLNERAYDSYIRYSENYEIPIYCLWVILSSEKIYYAKLPFQNPQYDFMPHDGNNVVKANDEEVYHIDKLIKELSLFKTLSLIKEHYVNPT